MTKRKSLVGRLLEGLKITPLAKRLALAGSLIIGSHLLVGGCGGSGGGGGGYIPPSNKPPITTMETSALGIKTSSSIGTTVGDADGTDPDNNTPLTYQLVSNHIFLDIDPNTGVVTTNRSLAPYEGTYQLRVRAVDSKGKAGNIVERTLTIGPGTAPGLTAPTVSGSLPENEEWSGTMTVTETEGDTATTSLESGPAGMTKVGNILYWTPNDSQVATNESSPITAQISATDVDGTTYRTITFPVGTLSNREDVTLTVRNSTDSSNPLLLASATINKGTANEVEYFADSGTGIITIPGLADGDHPIYLKGYDAETIPFEAGQLRTSRQQRLDGKTSGLVVLLTDKDDVPFHNATIRGNGQTRHPTQKLTWNLYTKEFSGGGDVSQTAIDKAVAAIKTRVSSLHGITYTDADINLINSPVVPGQPPEGNMTIYWDDSIPSEGGNYSWTNANNDILSGYAILKTTTTQLVADSEITEASADIEESNLQTSTHNSSPSAWSPADNVASSIYKRTSTGNTCTSTEERNPANHVINK